jgi:hypothetical protein
VNVRLRDQNGLFRANGRREGQAFWQGRRGARI